MANRRTVIAGNWKMNFTPAQATAFIEEIKPMVAGKDNCDIIFCAPSITPLQPHWSSVCFPTYQTHSHLRAFALAVPVAPVPLPTALQMIDSF